MVRIITVSCVAVNATYNDTERLIEFTALNAATESTNEDTPTHAPVEITGQPPSTASDSTENTTSTAHALSRNYFVACQFSGFLSVLVLLSVVFTV